VHSSRITKKGRGEDDVKDEKEEKRKEGETKASKAIMGVTKTTTSKGNGPIPLKGQTVTIQYTGFLKDPSKPDNKGQ
jgi:FKBP-type peptidyl-prolyl cis-trans isomerase